MQAGLGGRTGFADVAMDCGVGTFIGSFSGVVDDQGARDFALAVYRALLGGRTVGQAVQAARTAQWTTVAERSAMLFASYGVGELRLVSD